MERQGHPHLGDFMLHGDIEQHEWIAGAPALVLGPKVVLKKVPDDGCDGELCVELWVVKFVILYVSVRRVGLKGANQTYLYRHRAAGWIQNSIPWYIGLQKVSG